MQRFDALIIGGGPAGSTCGTALRRGGMQVAVLDQPTFPRDKDCAGWITPAVPQTLGLDLADYARERRIPHIPAPRTRHPAHSTASERACLPALRQGTPPVWPIRAVVKASCRRWSPACSRHKHS
jgi:glycine/D-amino acid oxidase-like deaminating enzyme